MYGEKMYLFPALLKAHRQDDRAVWEAYGKAWDIKKECISDISRSLEKFPPITLWFCARRTEISGGRMTGSDLQKE